MSDNNLVPNSTNNVNEKVKPISSMIVEIKLLHHHYKLSCPKENAKQLKQAEKDLNERLQEFQQNNPLMENEKLVLLVALQLMQELDVANSELRQKEQHKAQIHNLNEQLTRYINQIKE